MDLNLSDFENAIKSVIDNGLAYHAPLGSCGANITLAIGSENRVSEVSVRLHNVQVELLITNKSKEFLYYGKWHKRLGVDFIAKEHFRVYGLLAQVLFEDAVNKIAL